MHNAKRAHAVVTGARDILANIQAVYTYDGTDTVLSLIVGRETTGRQAFS